MRPEGFSRYWALLQSPGKAMHVWREAGEQERTASADCVPVSFYLFFCSFFSFFFFLSMEAQVEDVDFFVCLSFTKKNQNKTKNSFCIP